MHLLKPWARLTIALLSLFGLSLLTSSLAFAHAASPTVPSDNNPPTVAGCYTAGPIGSIINGPTLEATTGYTVYTEVDGYYSLSTSAYCGKVLTFVRMTPITDQAGQGSLTTYVITPSGKIGSRKTLVSSPQPPPAPLNSSYTYSEVVSVGLGANVCAYVEGSLSLASTPGKEDFNLTSSCGTPPAVWSDL